MTVFLVLNTTDNEGTIRYKTMVNPDKIILIDPIGPKYCRLLLHSFPSQEIYVEGSMDDLHLWLTDLRLMSK